MAQRHLRPGRDPLRNAHVKLPFPAPIRWRDERPLLNIPPAARGRPSISPQLQEILYRAWSGIPEIDMPKPRNLLGFGHQDQVGVRTARSCGTAKGKAHLPAKYLLWGLALIPVIVLLP